MKTQIQLILILLFCNLTIISQNLLDTSTWTFGQGSTSGFIHYGNSFENSREFSEDPFGNFSLIWKAIPDNNINADGGWDTSSHIIDYTKTYRFTIWLKKTNSNNGSSYFGTASHDISGRNSILRLNGTINTNPYFFAGDLPNLDKWYLVVGYVHGNAYNSTINYGGIYDPISGDKVVNVTDYKFAINAINTKHRSYLSFDTNTSDRQYFFNPRIDMVNGEEPSIQELLGANNVDTNLLDSSTWSVGSGSTTGFNQNGTSSENIREWGKNHVGEDVVLWKAIPDASNGPDGGWNTNYHVINHIKTHRFSVWVKKTNSNSGITYLGCRSSNNILQLNGTINNNPYFWSGDLPKLNRWYLVVGYVHKSNYSPSSRGNLGRIYDGVTGEEVLTITDYMFKNTAVSVQHRSYLYYDTNTSDRQYFWAPRIDAITGNEPTINELLQLNEDSKLIFSYDVAGNQKQRFYCEENGFCSPPAPTSKIANELVKKNEENITETPIGKEEVTHESQYTIYPNPTNGKISVSLSGVDYSLTNSVSIYNANGSLIQKININKPINQIDLDVSNESMGTYFIHMHFTNGTIATEKIIKK